MLRLSAGRCSRWNSFPPEALLPLVLKFWRDFSRLLGPGIQKSPSSITNTSLPPMKIGPKTVRPKANF
jgi:hypothetical protein